MASDVIRSIQRTLSLTAIVCLIGAVSPSMAQKIPPDPLGTPTNGRPPLTQTEFNGWFASGKPTLDGLVKPAKSLDTLEPNFDFYRWSEQMFLWVNSPLPDGSGKRLFNSPTFFDISPPSGGPNGARTFIPHNGGPALLAVRAAQRGAHGLPVILDAQGRILEVESDNPALPNKLQLKSITGKLLDIEHAKLSGDGKLMLFDAGGNAVKPKLEPPASKNAAPLLVREFMVDKTPVFVDTAGNVVNVEEGQANTEGVLVTQSNSFIYYETIVNDVFAYYLTGVKNNQIKSNRFPTTQPELDQVTAVAGKSSVVFTDSDALSVEIKAAWVEASAVSNPKDYITTTAVIPTYDTTGTLKWTPTGTKTTTLALVGMHVVGSVAQHPEMIWATFEHVGNAPDEAYSYINTQGKTVSVPRDTSGTWLFCRSNSKGPFNVQRNKFDFKTGNVIPFAHGGVTSVGPSDVIRWRAWGASSTINPNPFASSAASNSEVILINDEVLGMLPDGDVRKNYIFKGATWTGGDLPDPSPQVGTSALANTTMETYQQGSDATAGSEANCMDCHGGNGVSTLREVSHMWQTAPLPP